MTYSPFPRRQKQCQKLQTPSSAVNVCHMVYNLAHLNEQKSWVGSVHSDICDSRKKDYIQPSSGPSQVHVGSKGQGLIKGEC